MSPNDHGDILQAFEEDNGVDWQRRDFEADALTEMLDCGGAGFRQCLATFHDRGAMTRTPDGRVLREPHGEGHSILTIHARRYRVLWRPGCLIRDAVQAMRHMAGELVRAAADLEAEEAAWLARHRPAALDERAAG